MAVIGSTISFPGVSDVVSIKLILTLLAVSLLAGTTWLVVDYIRMLLLHKKMVSRHQSLPIVLLRLTIEQPPGPTPLPIIGNTHLLPQNKPWIYFESLSKSLNSPVITFWIGRNPTVWINDCWSATELLEKKAAIYASRPRMVVFAELTGMGQSANPHDKHPGSNLVTMYYGDRWRVHVSVFTWNRVQAC